MKDLDCTGPSSCFATDQAGNLLTWTGGAVWPLTTFSELPAAFDCAGTSCLATGWIENTFRTYTNGSWSGMKEGSASTWFGQSVLCSSHNRCFVPHADTYDAWNGSSWSQGRLPADLGSEGEITGDCPTSTFCLAVGQRTRTAVSWNGSRWTSRGTVPVRGDGLLMVDCATAVSCMVSGGQQTAVLSSGGWRSSGSTDPYARALACRTATHCLAVVGNRLWSWDGVRWSPTNQTFELNQTSDQRLRCVGTARCVLIAGDRAWWTS